MIDHSMRRERQKVGQASSDLSSPMRASPITERESFNNAQAAETVVYAHLNVDDCEPWTYHDRILSSDPDEEMIESMRINGQRHPGMVKKKDGEPGKFWIIYGVRRWNSCKRAGIPTFCAEVADKSDEEFVVDILIENSNRKDISAIERALQIQKLEHGRGHSFESTLKNVGISKSMFYKFREIAGISSHPLLFGALREYVTLLGFNEAHALAQRLKVLESDLAKGGGLTAAEADMKSDFTAVLEGDEEAISALKVAGAPSAKIGAAKKAYVKKVISTYWMLITGGDLEGLPAKADETPKKIPVTFSGRSAVATVNDRDIIFKMPRSKKLTRKMVNEATAKFKEFLEERISADD